MPETIITSANFKKKSQRVLWLKTRFTIEYKISGSEDITPTKKPLFLKEEEHRYEFSAALITITAAAKYSTHSKLMSSLYIANESSADRTEQNTAENNNDFTINEINSLLSSEDLIFFIRKTPLLIH